jgi:hypothetical protein
MDKKSKINKAKGDTVYLVTSIRNPMMQSSEIVPLVTPPEVLASGCLE